MSNKHNTYRGNLRFKSFRSTTYKNLNVLDQEVNLFLEGDEDNYHHVVKMKTHTSKRELFVTIWFYIVPNLDEI